MTTSPVDQDYPTIHTIPEDNSDSSNDEHVEQSEFVAYKPNITSQVCASESVFNRLGIQGDLPERPDSLPKHWKLAQNEKLMASPRANEVGTSPFETPNEYQANLCDLTTGSNESEEQQQVGNL